MKQTLVAHFGEGVVEDLDEIILDQAIVRACLGMHRIQCSAPQPPPLCVSQPTLLPITHCLWRNGAQELCTHMRTANSIAANMTQRPDANKTALFLCDLQEKFRPVIHEMGAVIDTSRLMLAASIELGLPVAVTEQYPRGLGHTVSELSELLTPQHAVVEKVTFSMMCSSENEDPVSAEMMHDFIIGNDIRKVLLCGVETHVCVLQTTLDLLAMDIDVTIIVDGVSSQRPTDRSVALDRLAKAGAVLSTAEATLFQLLADAKHPSFKSVSKLVQQPRTFTEAGGLLGL